uniref:G-protein coupled receptor 3 n=1 Tax=Polyphagotarsonemus latus TaxID=1204166 RepID=A0AAN0N7P4_9ACAR
MRVSTLYTKPILRFNVKWFSLILLINFLVPNNFVNCVSKCQKTLDETAQAYLDNRYNVNNFNKYNRLELTRKAYNNLESTQNREKNGIFVSQESRAFQMKPKLQQYNKANSPQINNGFKYDKYQSKYQKPSHRLSSSSNQTPHYFSTQALSHNKDNFFDNLQPPFILLSGDVYVAYFDCINQNNIDIETTAPLVQSAMSAVWAAHRFNQFNLTTSSMSIKLGVYFFDICDYEKIKGLNFFNETFKSSVNSLVDDNQIENYLKLIEFNSINNQINKHTAGIIPKTSVRSYQKNGKQQIHKMKPVIGLLVDMNKLSSQSITKLNNFDLPVININKFPDYENLSFESDIGLNKRIFNVYPSVQQLCKGVFSLIKKLNWTFALLDFGKQRLGKNLTSNDYSHIENKLSSHEQTFLGCLSKLSARDAAFTFRIDSTDAQNLDNEIIFLTNGKSQTFMNALVAGYLSNKSNRVIVTLDNLSSQLDTAIIDHHLAGKRFDFSNIRKGRSLEEFNNENGPFFVMPDWDISSEFFDFFNIELKNANIQSKHRFISKLSEQLLFKAFNTKTIKFSEQELNLLRPVVHQLKGNNDPKYQKNKFNLNLNKLLKSRNLFEVNNSPRVVHTIDGVWTLGFTLSNLSKEVCLLNNPSIIERKKNCLNQLLQVFDSNKPFVRNITIHLNESLNKNESASKKTKKNNRLFFNHNLQLATINYTINRLNDSQLQKVAYYSECCGFKVIHPSLDENFGLLTNSSMQPIYFKNRMNNSFKSTPLFGTRLSSTTKTKPLTSTIPTTIVSDEIKNYTEPNESTTESNNKITSILTTEIAETTLNILNKSASEIEDIVLNDKFNSTQMISSINDEVVNLIKKTDIIATTEKPKEVFKKKEEQKENKTSKGLSAINLFKKFYKKIDVDNLTSTIPPIEKKKLTIKPKENLKIIKEKFDFRVKTKKLYKNVDTFKKNNTSNIIADSTNEITSVSSVFDRHFSNQFKKNTEAEVEKRFSIVLLFLSIGGSLLTLYVFIFLLVKSCEGSLRHHSHQALALTQLVAILIVYCSSGLYVFQLNSFKINLRNSIHNVALALLFACLLQRALFLRAQKWIGLGGKISMLNQCIILLLIFGVQLALEVQKWSYETFNNQDSSNSELNLIKNQSSPTYFINGQLYLMFTSCLLLLVAFTARQQPFTYKEGKHIYLTSLICCPLYLGSVIFLFKYLTTMNYYNLQMQEINLNSTINLTAPQSLQWTSNISVLENKLKTVNLDKNQFHSNKTLLKNEILNSYLNRSTIIPKNDVLRSLQKVKRTTNLNQPEFEYFLKLNATNVNQLDYLENLKEYTDYQQRLNVIKFVDLVQSFILLVLATISLFGIFGPIIISIHKNEDLSKKQVSYSDSLSTAFTLFKTGTNSQQQFIINKGNEGKSFFNPFSFNQRNKDINTHFHSQFKQLTNSLKTPSQIKCSSSTNESITTRENNFTDTDSSSLENHDNNDLDQNIQLNKQTVNYNLNCESDIDEDFLSENDNTEQNDINDSKNSAIFPPPPLPSQFKFDNADNESKSPTSNRLIINTAAHIGSGAQFNYATTPNYHKFKYVLNNLSQNLGQPSTDQDKFSTILNQQSDDPITSSTHPSPPPHPSSNPIITTSYLDSSKTQIIRTNPIYEVNQFRSAYP